MYLNDAAAIQRQSYIFVSSGQCVEETDTNDTFLDLLFGAPSRPHLNFQTENQHLRGVQRGLGGGTV